MAENQKTPKVLTLEMLENAMRDYNAATAGSQKREDIYNSQQQLLMDYANGDAEIDMQALEFFARNYLPIFAGKMNESDDTFTPTPAGELALTQFQKDILRLQEAIRQNDNDRKQPDNDKKPSSKGNKADHVQKPEPITVKNLESIQSNIEKMRQRSPYSDQNQYMMDRQVAAVYHDMGIISADDYAKSDPKSTIEILGKIPDLKGEKAIEFSERLIDRVIGNAELFEKLPPTTLAYAYNGTKERIKSGKGDQKVLGQRLKKITARIDSLIDNFATNTAYHFADTTNISDVYDGYNAMFDARVVDLDPKRDAVLINQIETNRGRLGANIKDYDGMWGLSNVKPQDAEKLEPRWAELIRHLDNFRPSENIVKLAAKYKFLDKEGKPIPQFRDSKGKKQINYQNGYILDENGRLNRVIELAKHDVAMRNVALVDQEINQQGLENDVNERIPFKLFEIDTADKVIQGAMEHPEQFSDPKFLEKFVKDLDANGGSISDNGYEAAMDAQVNQTGGFASRLKSKLKDGAKKVGGFFGKLFKPVADIDKRAETRVIGSRPDKRKKRIEFFVRILKGFGSAFLVSAAITTIATAAAATAGISVAASLATVGVITGIVMSAVQIHKWQKRQRDAGLPTDYKAFFKDPRMVATMGTTALGAAAMVFGAAGLREAALALGYGALAVGGTKNSIEMFKDARKSGMGITESIIWSVGNAVAIAGGGVAGRFAANAGINAYNRSNPENTLFQTKESHQEVIPNTREETKMVYNDDAVANAEKITRMWYQDNPAELQHRVDMINQYNAEHGTNINPYRAILLSADAGGRTFDNMALHVDGGGVTHSGSNHNVINTAQWRADHGFGADEMNSLKNLFAGDQINPQGLDVAMRVDHYVSANNEVGVVTAGDTPHYDGVLPRNTFDADGNPVFNTYADGNSVFHSETVTIIDNVLVDVTTYTPVDVPFGLGMFGISYPRTKADFEKLGDRVGSLLDRVKEIQKDKLPDKYKKPEQPDKYDEPLQLTGRKEPFGLLPPHTVETAKKRQLGDDAQDPLNLDQDEKNRRQEYARREREDKEWGKQFAKDFAIERKEHSVTQKPKVKQPDILDITRATAKRLDELPTKIAAIEKKRQQPGLKKAEADKMWIEQKRLSQELQTMLNKLGRPSDNELAAAKADAYRRHDLQAAVVKLENIRARKNSANKASRSKYELDELHREEQMLLRQIEQLGGQESLNDDSYLVQPVPFKPEYTKAQPTDTKQKMKNSKETIRKRLDLQSDADKRKQEKLRRLHYQKMQQMHIKQSTEKK